MGLKETTEKERQMMDEKRIVIGCIADDFTGAGDAASFLVQGGLKTVMFNGIPKAGVEVDSDCQAVVIALKTRTQETGQAVKDSMDSARWLTAHGANHLYFKYCSTFDSTKEGNIGPVADALLETYQQPYTILCPALPVNKRVVKHGCLYVDGVPLHESPMKTHPLTPMWASDLSILMEAQSRYRTIKIAGEELYQPIGKLRKKISAFEKENDHFYIIPDYVDNRDAGRIAELFGDLKILTGGSGLLPELVKYYHQEPNTGKKTMIGPDTSSGTTGKALILAGSCSDMTLRQIRTFKNGGGKWIQIKPDNLISGEQKVDDIWNQIQAEEDELLVYSSESADKVKEYQKKGKMEIADMLEETMALLAQMAVNAGYRRIIVAGGETSGAVMKKLGYDSYIIGESIAPGVPVMTPASERNIRLVLKSGNFGQDDFFERALEKTKKG